MAPHSSTPAWKIPWTEEPGRLQSMGSRRVGHDWTTSLSLSCIGEGNGNPLQCSCLENPRDRGASWAAVHGVVQSRTRLKRLSSKRIWWMRQNFVTQLVQLLKCFFVRCAVMHCHAEELGPFWSLMLAVDLAFFSASHWFVEHSSQL